MPTKWTDTLIPTSRQVPAEAEVPSHQLMIRAGFIHRLGSGVYDYLPLGLRSLRKATAIIRQEMDAVGAIEVLLPTLQPIELWEQTGRRAAYGDNLFVVQDRHGRFAALGPTHEEVVTELVGAFVESYKQLPLTLYQIQTKFRDEFRPRFGVLRSREFHMKDAYSFHLEADGPGGLEQTYRKQYEAYCRIFDRCGLPYEVVEAESGPMGGSASHEFMVPSPTGEDLIFQSDKDNYAANVEKCEIGDRPFRGEDQPTGELEKFHTPGCPGIEDLVKFFSKTLRSKLKPANTLKTLVCQDEGGKWVLAVVRGDHELNFAKLSLKLGRPVALADEAEAKSAGFAVGYVGPHVAVGRRDIDVVVDFDAAQGGFWVAGANELDHHVKHFHWNRDLLQPDLWKTFRKVHASLTGRPGSTQSDQRIDLQRDNWLSADIRNAADGDPSPKNDGGVLRATRGIELGHVFKLGRKYTDAMKVTVLDKNNERKPLLMGCYGIGVNRILAAAIERDSGHDDHGIIWPAAIAPFAVLVTPIKYEGAMREATDRLAAEFEAAGLDVLVDDRCDRAGVKFKDADLIGIPVRVTIGEKALASGQVEVKPRRSAQADLVPIHQAARRVVETLGAS